MASRISQIVSQLLPPPFRNSKHLAASASTASSSSPTSSPTNSSTSARTTTTAMPERPPFDALPLRKDGPHGNAWGLFGDSDELGMLNLLTAENTAAAAASEIRDGTRVPLDWPLNRMPKPCFGRRVASHVIKEEAPKYTVNDDELTINTQSSTQWDGYRHFGYQKEKLFFNGRTQEDLRASTVNGTQAWVEHGGIVGRGVLIDYASWADAHSIPITPFQTTPIPISTLKQVAADQNLTFQRGDILLVRYGFTRAYDALTHDEALATGKEHPTTIGVESSEETLRWLWDEGFAAVVGDTLTFEAWPCQDWKFWLHEWLLAGWGMPIGELFDLERLSEECKRRKRWSFFFSSMPLKVPGGVASPPCGMAIF